LKAGGFGAWASEALERAGIDARARAETIEPARLRSLAQAVFELGGFGAG
jgi:hypothetical protein